MLRGAAAIAAAASALPAPRIARAAGPAWPPRPITIVVPYSPGGGTDIFARALAEGMRSALGQTVVVENKAGANGIIGAEYVSRSTPDGCMLAVCTGAHVINRYSMAQIPFDPVKDFTPISKLSSFPLVVAATEKAPFNDVAGLLAAAREKPGSISFGTTEAATSYAGNSFARQAGIRLVEVPYRGSGPQLNDLIAGHISLAVTSTVAVLPYLNGGGIKALGVTSTTRSPLIPNVPTLTEAGIRDYEFTGWYGMYGPKGIPPEIAAKLYAAIQATLANPTIGKKLKDLGADLDSLGPDGFPAFLEQDDKRWAAAAREGLITAAP
ncbi:tripartite tricarboxylate transporter substrate binding protein [Roseomonas marmotae]|uniref:Tripartite tricarboxylate transporter substrate binding protein n=1 Tax=Roseomonas marmotae TaxID=2768161 RepID=A0ABS3KC17_9PROT|nr:tripartite tricarboxylate transporter substrate binding protein [Roseomonas marmotae]QTI80814.1 tripartite tricarboxylate transporter substrate binding protein [Roseomonas marmotae]